MPSTSPRADAVTQPRHSPNFFQAGGSSATSPAHALSRRNSLEDWEKIESPVMPPEEDPTDKFEPIERAVQPLTEQLTDEWVDVDSALSSPPNGAKACNDQPSFGTLGEQAANILNRFKANITSILPTSDTTQAALLAATMAELAAANQKITELQSTLAAAGSACISSHGFLTL